MTAIIEGDQMEEYQALNVTEVDQPPATEPVKPSWGILAGVGVWFFSHVSPFPFLFVWVLFQYQRGTAITTTGADGGSQIVTAEAALASVAATAIGHILTLFLCWAVVTGFGARPFLASLGWHWGGLSRWGRLLLVFGVVAAVYMVNIALVQFLPEAEETSFSQMLKTSNAVRVVVACMAVLTAPIVEEVVYRGMLYSPLRSRFGIPTAVMIVTIVFALVHLPQYKGAWASLTGLAILSFVLTLIRAVSRSILPCVAIHLVYNFIGSLFILRPVFQ